MTQQTILRFYFGIFPRTRLLTGQITLLQIMSSRHDKILSRGHGMVAQHWLNFGSDFSTLIEN